MDIKILASGSTGNAYVVSDGKTTLLLDAGIPFQKIQKGMNYKTSQIAACLVTHRHGDHARAIPKLLGRGIPIYGPSDLAKEWPFSIKELWVSNEKDTKRGWYTVSESFEVMPFPVHHDVDCLGFLIASKETGERLLYMTDTTYTEYKFDGLTHIMIECNHSQEKVMQNARDGVIPGELAERIMRSHMSIEAVLGLLRANDRTKLKQIYLLHLSDTNSDAEDFRRRVQEETGAEVYVV
jgi:phosphoribosyl 1,2-cyclic phosphodiesterase